LITATLGNATVISARARVIAGTPLVAAYVLAGALRGELGGASFSVVSTLL
jgi:hypothetical protein